MVYKFSEAHKKKTIRANQKSISIQYGLGVLFLVYMLINNWADSSVETKTLLFFGLAMFPIAWWYFDRNFKRKMSTTYEIENGRLIIKENDQLKHQVSLISITNMKENLDGHSFDSNSGSGYILHKIENKEELLERIKRKDQ